ncbi:MAG: family 10 glycosylhydrolase [Burkholderiales bacterium]|nr:family 10 glycosylhydrolase [Burkholderiales bacterium]
MKASVMASVMALCGVLVALGPVPSQAQVPASRATISPSAEPNSRAQVRGTWLTTTANDALASPEHTARTMQRLREIGLNTVYIEAWKNGYTQFPSEVLRRAIGVAQRPAGREQDPTDSALARAQAPRDLLHEAVTEAHRNGLLAIAWFEYGFMAAHQSTLNHLRQAKPDWLSRDLQGREVAPNGFVWLNPLHPQARELLLDLVLEAIDRYDLDGIQLDDRIVWPHVTMGYDDYTRRVYAAEHQGAQPPADHQDPAWMRWRAAKVDEYARWFVQEVRARRPGLVVSLSPAVYPWSWEHYLLDWPRWTAWSIADHLSGPPVRDEQARHVVPHWDEVIPQAYRLNYAAFEKTWREQTAAVQARGAYRPSELVAGIRIVGDGPDSSWDQLRRSMELVDGLGQGGHVLWFSRGVLDLYAQELQAWYRQWGPAHSPRFPVGWRPGSWALVRAKPTGTAQADSASDVRWATEHLPAGRYRMVGRRPASRAWQEIQSVQQDQAGPAAFVMAGGWDRVELLIDRREAMRATLRVGAPGAQAAAVLAPTWEPRYPGVATAQLQLSEPRQAVLHMARVDLRTPCLQWLATPPAGLGEAPLAPPGRHTPETIGVKTSTFLRQHQLHLAINAAPFGPVVDQEGLLMDVAGFQVSQGRPVSGPSKDYPALLLMADGSVRIQPPPFPQQGVLNAVGGFDIVLRDGQDVAPKAVVPSVHPRTAVGVSSDGRWMWLLVVDGRQLDYSLGATLHDLAAWLKALGASEGINLDGGGTSALVLRGSSGQAELVNRPIHRNIPGNERVSASHLGLRVGSKGEGGDCN